MESIAPRLGRPAKHFPQRLPPAGTDPHPAVLQMLKPRANGELTPGKNGDAVQVRIPHPGRQRQPPAFHAADRGQ